MACLNEVNLTQRRTPAGHSGVAAIQVTAFDPGVRQRISICRCSA
jgi:hypothetical protein